MPGPGAWRPGMGGRRSKICFSGTLYAANPLPPAPRPPPTTSRFPEILSGPPNFPSTVAAINDRIGKLFELFYLLNAKKLIYILLLILFQIKNQNHEDDRISSPLNAYI